MRMLLVALADLTRLDPGIKGGSFSSSAILWCGVGSSWKTAFWKEKHGIIFRRTTIMFG
jgi:hypothetical protein